MNGWFGDDDKLSMTRRLLELGLDADRDGERVAYLGGSPRDEPMFAAFPVSIGVDSARAFLHRPDAPLRFVTRGRSGLGFADAERLIAARGSQA